MKLKVLTPFTYKGEPVKKDQMIDVDPKATARIEFLTKGDKPLCEKVGN